MMSGMNYFIFDITNITDGKEFSNTNANVEIISPSKKISSVSFVMNIFYRKFYCVHFHSDIPKPNLQR